MLRFIFLLGIGLLPVLPGWAQERVANVRLRAVDSVRLEIRYDLLVARPGDSVFFAVRSRQRGLLDIRPEFVRGDVGLRVTAGRDRRIVWDALDNGYLLNDDVRATVLVKAGPPDLAGGSVAPTPDPQPTTGTNPPTPPAPTNRRTRYAGPAWALLSAVAPGTGNIFVQTPRPRVGFRPLLTAADAGLLLYGLNERRQANDAYAVYEQQKNVTAGEPYYQTANDHHHRYYVATRAAVVLAAADVLLTFLRGLRNGRQPATRTSATRMSALRVQPSWQAGLPTAGLRYSF